MHPDYLLRTWQNDLESPFSDSNSRYIYHTCKEYDVLIQWGIYHTDI